MKHYNYNQLMKTKLYLKLVAILITVALNSFLSAQTGKDLYGQKSDYEITEYGAKADGLTLNTQSIQKAIDQCSINGGGTVIVPPGVFLTGSISLKNHVTLYLTKNAVLRGSTNIAEYSNSQNLQALVSVYQVEDVSITGEGVIDGQGNSFPVKDNAPNRPYVVLVQESKNIHIENVKLKNSAMWTLRLRGSEHIIIKGISIYSHTNFNNDGIDIDSKDVVISDCIIDCDDDALCFKTDSRKTCENVAVTNCIISSNCNFIKFGTASLGGFKNISIGNCVLRPASESNHRFWNKSVPGVTDSITGISGIALEVVDGGFMDHVTISNISMIGVQTPIFIRLGSRRNPTGYLKNVIISNIIATTHSKIPCLISGVPGFYIENVILRDMFIACKGGGELSDVTRVIPENEKGYPENRMFGFSLPAYGMYIRHARNITIDNLQFELLQPDYRPALYFDDAQDIHIRHLKAAPPSGNTELIIKKITDKILIE